MPLDSTPERVDRHMPYWLRPTVLITATLGGPALLAAWLPDAVFTEEWKSPKFFQSADAWNISLAILCFAIGAGLVASWHALARTLNPGRQALPPERERLDILRPAFYVAAALTLFGTLVWIVVAARQGIHLPDVGAALTGDNEAVARIRRRAVTLPGITTLTQVGIALGVFAGLLWHRAGHNTVRLIFLAVVLLTLLRAIVRAERLALMEIMVPFCVALLPHWLERNARRPFVRIGLLATPFAAIGAVFIFFMLAEAGRSYEAKLEEGLQRDVVTYSAIRIEGYYGTSLNNGAYLSRRLADGPLPYFALEWLWRFPGIGAIFDVPRLTGMSEEDVLVLLDLDLNPEFNNPSGFFSYRYDFGWHGVLVFFFGLGLVAAWLHSGYRDGRITGRLLYPVFVIGLLEIARVPYFTSTRVFPAWIILITAAAVHAFVAWRMAPVEGRLS